MPDGRKQIVEYKADGDFGYEAEVKYDEEAIKSGNGQRTDKVYREKYEKTDERKPPAIDKTFGRNLKKPSAFDTETDRRGDEIKKFLALVDSKPRNRLPTWSDRQKSDAVDDFGRLPTFDKTFDRIKKPSTLEITDRLGVRKFSVTDDRNDNKHRLPSLEKSTSNRNQNDDFGQSSAFKKANQSLEKTKLAYETKEVKKELPSYRTAEREESSSTCYVAGDYGSKKEAPAKVTDAPKKNNKWPSVPVQKTRGNYQVDDDTPVYTPNKVYRTSTTKSPRIFYTELL